jgi:hypothetical protein
MTKKTDIPHVLATLLCSDCFRDHGLKLEAMSIGRPQNQKCPNCGSVAGHALDNERLHNLQKQFFSRATAPNQYRQDVAVLGVVEDAPEEHDIGMLLRPETIADWELIRTKIGGRFWYRSPRLFYLGITSHFGIYQSLTKDTVHDEIVPKLRFCELSTSTTIYRIRTNLSDHEKLEDRQFDAPPAIRRRGFGRFDNKKLPLLYGSPNLQVCVHECRVTLVDEIFVASLKPRKSLILVDLTGNYDQPDDVSPFDDLEWFFRGLMNASQPHVYRYCRRIAQTIREMTDADGFVYNSYYTNIAGDSEGPAINYAFFGHPIAEGKIAISSINTIRLNQISYSYHLGPVFVQT